MCLEDFSRQGMYPQDLALLSIHYMFVKLVNRLKVMASNPLALHSNHVDMMLAPQFSSVQSLSHVQLFVTPGVAVHQASLSITDSWSSLRLTSIELVMPSSHLILCRSLLLLPPIAPSIRVFSNELAPCMRWPKYWSFSLLASFLPKNTQD